MRDVVVVCRAPVSSGARARARLGLQAVRRTVLPRRARKLRRAVAPKAGLAPAAGDGVVMTRVKQQQRRQPLTSSPIRGHTTGAQTRHDSAASKPRVYVHDATGVERSGHHTPRSHSAAVSTAEQGTHGCAFTRAERRTCSGTATTHLPTPSGLPTTTPHATPSRPRTRTC